MNELKEGDEITITKLVSNDAYKNEEEYLKKCVLKVTCNEDTCLMFDLIRDDEKIRSLTLPRSIVLIRENHLGEKIEYEKVGGKCE